MLRKKLTYFFQSSKYATGNEVDLKLHFWIWKLLLTNFKSKVDLLPLLPLYPKLTLEIFIGDMFNTIADVSSIIFDLRLHFFANAKVFE